MVGTSRNFSHSVFVAFAPGFAEKSELWPGDKTVGEVQPSLYEYTEADKGEPRLVGVSNSGSVASVADGDLVSECGTYLGGPSENAYNAVSEGGTTVFFTALGHDYSECSKVNPGVEPSVNELYARLDGGQADARTIAISEPSKADCGECELLPSTDAEFQGASLNGSKVFFTTAQHLLRDAGAGTNLYEYDFSGPPEGRVTLLSAGDLVGAAVQRVVHVSEDGSHVYFIAKGVLTGNERNIYGSEPQKGGQNLYVYERDALHPGGHLAFIATASVGAAQATLDGRFLVFESSTDITPDEKGTEAGQVFEYDAQTAMLVRVSRGEHGYSEDGNSSVYPATIPAQTYKQDLPVNEFTKLAVSGNGAYVFFTTEDSLTPQALSGVVNVYEYHEGQVALISDGHDLAASVLEVPSVELLGTDESGQDVYFRTADQLVPQDTDTQLDVYDARIEGGFPASSAEPSCSGDPCEGPLASSLQAPVPPTSSSSGEVPIARAPGAPPKGKPASRRPKAKAKKKSEKHRRKAKRASGGGR